MAIRVNQVEKRDFPWNLCKWKKAFCKLSDMGEASHNGQNRLPVPLDENFKCASIPTFGGKDERRFFVPARELDRHALRQRGTRGDSPGRVRGRDGFRSIERCQLHWPFLRVCDWSSRIMCCSDCERARIRSRFVRSKLMTSFSAMHRHQVQAESHS